MIAFFQSITPTQWIIVGLVLLIVEVFAPGAVFVWFGVAALVVGALSWMLPLAWQVQVVIFALLSVGSLWGYRVWRKRLIVERSDEPLLNQKARQLIGRVFPLVEAIEGGRGKLKVGDALWTAIGTRDFPVGTRVKVTGVRDQMLEVEAE
jgi:membrane protein implicated in regulation of membrane protease activity